MTLYAAVANFRTKLDAEVAAGLLQNAGIPYVIQSTEGMLHGPITPGATILVARAQAANARQILEDAEMTDGDPDDAAAPDAAPDGDEAA